jgi:ribose 5-phosphate isomerase A
MMSEAGGRERNRQKRMAAAAAVEEIADGMVVGLGTGSTAAFALEAIAERLAEGLRILGIPTSEATAEAARRLGIPLTDFAAHPTIDLTIDGADEVERGTLDLVKGGGGALLREKNVASASRRMIVVVDEGKLVDRLGSRMPLPVEVVPFGWQAAAARLAATGAEARLRMAGATPFQTDGGNYIVDCAYGGIADAPGLERRLDAIVGVVESGLFVGLAAAVIVGTTGGLRRIER